MFRRTKDGEAENGEVKNEAKNGEAENGDADMKEAPKDTAEAQKKVKEETVEDMDSEAVEETEADQALKGKFKLGPLTESREPNEFGLMYQSRKFELGSQNNCKQRSGLKICVIFVKINPDGPYGPILDLNLLK